jgi:hypothetical protein
MTPDQIKTAAANGNNGYADFPPILPEIKAELTKDGFTFEPSSSVYPQGVRVYAPKANTAPSMIRPKREASNATKPFFFDYELAILTRDERLLHTM